MAMTLRLTDEDERALQIIQRAHGASSKHQAVLLAIREQAARDQDRNQVLAAADRVLTDYGAVLDRLANT